MARKLNKKFKWKKNKIKKHEINEANAFKSNIQLLRLSHTNTHSPTHIWMYHKVLIVKKQLTLPHNMLCKVDDNKIRAEKKRTNESASFLEVLIWI